MVLLALVLLVVLLALVLLAFVPVVGEGAGN